VRRESFLGHSPKGDRLQWFKENQQDISTYFAHCCTLSFITGVECAPGKSLQSCEMCERSLAPVHWWRRIRNGCPLLDRPLPKLPVSVRLSRQGRHKDQELEAKLFHESVDWEHISLFGSKTMNFWEDEGISWTPQCKIQWPKRGKQPINGSTTRKSK